MRMPLTPDRIPARVNPARRFREPVASHYDVVVVGSGMGGLVSAALLARAGRRVLVLDGHYVAGGNATVFRRKRWEFDVGIHYLGDCGPCGQIPRVLRACGAGGVRFLPMDSELERITFPDGEFVIPRSRQVFHERLLAAFPDEARGIDRYIRFLEQVERMQSVQTGGRLQQLVGLLRSPLVVRYGLGPLGDLLDSCTRNPRLRAILTAQSGTYAIEPRRVSAVLHAGLQNHYLIDGGWYPEGGGQVMSDALVAAIERAGGDIRLRADVRRIHVGDGGVTGVTFVNPHLGEVYVATPVVVSNADLKRTVAELVGDEHFAPGFARRVAGFEMALPLFVVFLGLDLPPENLPYGNCNRWIFADDDIDGEYAMLERGRMKEQPSLYIATASRKDPANRRLAPPGMTNLQIMAVVPSDPAFWGVDAAAVASGAYQASEGYRARKEEVVRRILAHAETAIPGLAGHIVYREASSPLTHTRYTRSTGGTSYGIAATPGQFLQNRPGARSPVTGLFLAGASMRTGHGIVGSMLSGVAAADAILRDGTMQRVLRADSEGNLE